MRRSKLVGLVAERTGMRRADSAAAVDAVFGSIGGALGRGETVRLAGFGTFAAKMRAARTGRNPRTGAEVAVPASRGVSFRPGKALRDAVNPGRGPGQG